MRAFTIMLSFIFGKRKIIHVLFCYFGVLMSIFDMIEDGVTNCMMCDGPFELPQDMGLVSCT